MIQLKQVQGNEREAMKKPLFDTSITAPRNSNLSGLSDSNRSFEIQSPFRLVNQPSKKKASMVEAQPDRLSVASYQDRQPEQFKQLAGQGRAFIFNNYDIMDLTFSLVDSNISFNLLLTLFLFQIVIRYFSIVCLIYVMIATNEQYWEWILILVFTYLLYSICIIKISIKIPETKGEYLLKQSFNSLEDNLEYFQVIDSKRLGRSILRGITPPELSFIYIENVSTNVKNYQIYVMINYIYNSIEAIVYYPFFLTYTILVYYKNILSSLGWIFPLSYSTILLSQAIFISLSTYLIIYGCHKKGFFQSRKKK